MQHGHRAHGGGSSIGGSAGRSSGVEGRTVLIVDELRDTREVLKTVLESCGMRIVEAERTSQGQELARRHRPDLIVLDLETTADGQPRGPSPLSLQEWQQVPMVVLGRATLDDGPSASDHPSRHFLAKPFHFVELIQTIEKLLR